MSYSPEIGFRFYFELKPSAPDYLKRIMRSTITEFDTLPREIRGKKNKQLYHKVPALFLNKGADEFRQLGKRYQRDNVYVGSGSMIIDGETIPKLLGFLNFIRKHIKQESHPSVACVTFYSAEDHIMMGTVVQEFGFIRYDRETQQYYAAMLHKTLPVTVLDLEDTEDKAFTLRHYGFKMYQDYDPVFCNPNKKPSVMTLMEMRPGNGNSTAFILKEEKTNRMISSIVNLLEDDTQVSVFLIDMSRNPLPGNGARQITFPDSGPKIYKAPEILTPHFPKNVQDILSTALFSVYNAKLVVPKGVLIS